MKHPSSGPVIAFALCVTALVFAACGRRETPVERATREGILLMGNGADPPTLDPQLITGLSDARIVSALFEGLANPDPKTLEPRPAVAESWSYDDKTLTWTFHLRPTARWSNGDPVTAGDFVYSYQRILTESLGSEYANMLYPIKNAREFHTGKLKDFAQVGVHALDDRTLTIQLDHPTSYFLSLLYHQTYFPVHPPTIKKYNAFSRRDATWAKAGTLVGNGPFVLTKYALGDEIEVKRNPHYWNSANLKLNGIRFFPITDLNTEERAFRNGLLHITSALPLTKIIPYRDSKSPYLRIEQVYGVYYYLLNTRKGPLSDPRIRLALNLAIDRVDIAEDVLHASKLPAYNYTPPSDMYQSRTLLKEDIPAAKKLLAEAGYPDGKGLDSLELIYNTSEAHRSIAEAIQQMWRKNLGIEVHLANLSWAAYLERRRGADYTIARASWYADYLDPSTFLEMFTKDNPLNQTGWANPQYDELIAAAAAETDPVKRMEIYQQAEALLMGDLPIMPIYFYTNICLIRPEVHGWENNLLDQHPYIDVSLVPVNHAESR